MVSYLNEVECLMEFVDGLKKAAGTAHAMAHYQANPDWLKIRDLLENVIEQGQRLATSKAMPRAQVLQKLDQRIRDGSMLSTDLNG